MTTQEWNTLHSIGTKVKYYPVKKRSDYRETTTRSEAWELGDGTPVVLIKGQAGGVSLAHLEVIT